MTAARKKLRLSPDSVLHGCLHKQSLDLRHGDLKAICSVELSLAGDEAAFVQKCKDPHVKLRARAIMPVVSGKERLSEPPVIVGFGPAGMFAAIVAAQQGNKVLLLEQNDRLGKKLLIWNIKSTTKAQEGLYMYDTIQRLYDGQFGEEGVDDIAHYIKLGKLGEAFKSEEQVVLLIDEIDKADLEFPNDLLWELDQMEFYIHETKETVKAIKQIAYEQTRLGYKVGIIATNETVNSYTTGVVKCIGARSNENSIAKNLYRVLREFDEEEVSYIYSEAFAEEGIGNAIMNRLEMKKQF